MRMSKGQPYNIITIMKSLDHQCKSRAKNPRREFFDNYRKFRFYFIDSASTFFKIMQKKFTNFGVNLRKHLSK